jgi:tetratricopeptide (TPR) repeat protein
VAGDPNNANYLRAFVENLQKKYNNNKKGKPLAQFQERGSRSALKKALAQEQWDEVIQHGLKVLAVNPWDAPTLVGMATAAKKSGDLDCEHSYLKYAVMASPKDATIYRLYAICLGDRGMFDQAIAAWHRVEELRPSDDEARRAVSVLMVQKGRARGDFNEDEDEITRKLRVQAQQQEELTAEQRLEQKIRREPENLATYMELAQIYVAAERFKESSELLARAYEVSNENIDVREKWEDSQIRYLRQQITHAQDPETKKKFQEEYFQKELEVYKNRVAQYPNNLAFKYELGYRYMLTKQYAEAIRELQAAQNDPRRKGLCMLALGQCFQHIKQYRLAMSNYQTAIEEIPDRDAENKKKALFAAARLAMAMKDIDTAEKHLTILAGIDFAYKDVSALLDKIAELRENSGDDAEAGPKTDESNPP